MAITNPTPAIGDWFGISVAALGTNFVLIGAHYDDTDAVNSGSAYLFSANGELITTFTNPAPGVFDEFGFSLASVGIDCVLVGAHYDDTVAQDAGAAYLFRTNGILLRTFTPPASEKYDRFGCSVAAVGTDCVLIGAEGSSLNSGAAYLFSTDGALLTTFTNPTPAAFDEFGCFVAAVGTDRVLIGSYGDDAGASGAGAAYLFATNGILLTTFTNPAPASLAYFGCTGSALGADRVVIGAYQNDGGGPGSAYLFTTNGSLLTTFTNPTPRGFDAFGFSVATVGSDRVLIGALGDDTGAASAGAAYLFTTNGTLLTTFTNPTPALGEFFGNSVAALGSDRVVIGAYQESSDEDSSGAVYLFNLVPPAPGKLRIEISVDSLQSAVTLGWPSTVDGWEVEQTSTLPSVPMSSWSRVPTPYETNGPSISVTLTNSVGQRSQFFRLVKP
jgi:hypothetical protein